MKGVVMETNNGNGNGGGGVAVELPAKASDMAAIMEALDQMPDETVRGVRRTTDWVAGKVLLSANV